MKTKLSIKKVLAVLAVVLLTCGAQAAATITIPALTGLKDKDDSLYTGDAYIVYMGSAVAPANHEWGEAFKSKEGLDIDNPPAGQVILKFSVDKGASAKQTISSPGTGINLILASTYQSDGKDCLFISNGNIMTTPPALLLTGGSWFTGKYASAAPEPTQAVISAIAVTDAAATITATNVTDGATYELIRCADLGVAEPEFVSLTPAVTATAAEGKVELVDPAKPAEKAFYKVTVPEK